jgi:hypothetical protein
VSPARLAEIRAEHRFLVMHRRKISARIEELCEILKSEERPA